MSVFEFSVLLLHSAAVVAVVLAMAGLGRLAARTLRQPEVIGEVVVGLLAGPLAVVLFGSVTFHHVLVPDEVLSLLKEVSKAALVLYIVGLAHGLRSEGPAPALRALSGVVTGSLGLALLTGAGMAGWVVLRDVPALRGDAPLPAFVLFGAVALAVTAVPVLARILSDRAETESVLGRLALSSAIIIDTVAWLLLSVAVALSSNHLPGFARVLGVLVAGLCAAVLIRRLLRTAGADRLCARTPRGTAVLIGVVAVVIALAIERWGLTAILGAALVGLAIPADRSAPWATAVDSVRRTGRALVPLFFVVTGLTVFADGFSAPDGVTLGVVLVLAVLGKVGGGYLGARLGGLTRPAALRIGVLMNTRGLTELVVLQVGFEAGILSRQLFLVLVVMAMITTAMTGPLLVLLDRHRLSRGQLALRQETMS